MSLSKFSAFDLPIGYDADYSAVDKHNAILSRITKEHELRTQNKAVFPSISIQTEPLSTNDQSFQTQPDTVNTETLCVTPTNSTNTQTTHVDSDTYKILTNNIKELIKDSLVKYIKDKNIILALDVTVLVSSVIGLISSTYVFVHTRNRTWINFIPIITSLTTLVTSLASLILQYDRTFYSGLIRVEELLVNFVTGIQENGLDSSHWVNNSGPDLYNITAETALQFISTLIGFVLTSACKLFNVDMRNLSYLLACRERIGKFSVDTVAFITNMLEQLNIIDINGKKERFAKYDRVLKSLQEYSKIPVRMLILQPALRATMEQTIKEANALVHEKITPQELGIYNTTRNTIAKYVMTMMEEQRKLAEITSAEDRQVTVGLNLVGEPGIGKSTIAMDIMDSVAQSLGYPRAVYDARPGKTGGDGFYLPYGGHKLGIVNEWGMLREKDPLISSINSLLSSDPVNLEGAALEFKTQMTALALVTLTSNDAKHDYTSLIKESHNIAMLDRLLMVEVVDEHYAGRQARNSHRRPDHSHLKFNRLVCKHRNPQTIAEALEFEKVPLTYNQLVAIVTGWVAFKEIEYFNRVIKKKVHMGHEYREMFEARIHQLKPYAECPQMYVDYTPEGFVKNSGLEIFPIRLQGKTGVGKTFLAENAMLRLSKVFGMATFKITKQSQLKDPNFVNHKGKPCIVFVDDLYLTTREYAVAYIEMINSLPPNSIVFNAENYCFSYNTAISWYSIICFFHTIFMFFKTFNLDFIRAIRGITVTRKYYHIPKNLDCPPAIYRRIGLNGPARGAINEELIGGLCFDVSHTAISEKSQQYTKNQFDCLVFDYYTAHLKSQNQPLVVHAPPPIHTADIVIKILDFKALLLKLQTTSGLLSLTSGSIVDIQINPSVFTKNITYAQLKELLLPQFSQTPDDIQIALAMAQTIKSLRIPLNILIYNGERRFSYINGVLYIVDGPSVDSIIMADCSIFVLGNYISPTTVAKYLVNPSSFYKIPELAKLPPEVLCELEDKLREFICLPNMLIYMTAYKLEIGYSEQFSKLSEMISNIPKIEGVGWKIGLGILGAVLAIGGTVAIYKHFNNKPVENSGQYDETIYRAAERVHRQVMKGKKREEAADLVIQQTGLNAFDKQSILSCYRDYMDGEAYIRQPKGTPKNAIEDLQQQQQINIRAARGRNRQNDDEYDIVYARDTRNRREFIESAVEVPLSQPSPIQHLVGKLNDQYAIVRGQTRANYGLCFYKNYILTVAHTFKDINDVVSINFPTSVGKLWTGKLIYRCTDTDVAIIQVIEARFPYQKDLRKHFISISNTFAVQGKCFWVRCAPPYEIYSGKFIYVDMTLSNVFSRLTNDGPTKSYIFDKFCALDAKEVFRRGDCGFPLIAYDNEPMILAIHNAYSTDQARFSPVCSELLYKYTSEFTSNAIESNNIPPYDYTEDLGGPLHYVTEEVVPFTGHVGKYHIHSRPEYKKKLTKSPDYNLPVNTIPAPTTCAELRKLTCIDKMAEYFDYGRTFPCNQIIQSRKYYDTIDFSPDPEILKLAVILHKQYALLTYGRVGRVLRDHEVINGIPNGHLRPVNQRTDAGLYIKATYNLHNKETLFENVAPKGQRPVYNFSQTKPAQDTKQHYLQICESFENGTPVNMVVSDNKKVELLPRADVENDAKVRLYSSCDLALNLALRKYFGYLNDSMMAHHGTSMSAIGMNPFIYPTYKMKDFIYLDADEPISTDIKRMDKHLHQFFIQHMCELAESLYPQDMTIPFQAICQTLTNIRHFTMGDYYDTTRGNPSGVFTTTLQNSIARELVIIYICLAALKRNGENIAKFTITQFLAWSRHMICGDDGTHSFSKKFNIDFEFMKECHAKFGLTLTPAKIEGVSFCSREYVQDQGIIYPRLKKDSIIQSLHYIDNSDRKKYYEIALVALFESTMWEKEFYDNVLSNIMIQLEYLGLDPLEFKILDYHQQREHFKFYVHGEERSPIITPIGRGIYELEDIDEYNISMQDNITFSTVPNYISKYYERISKVDDTGVPEVSFKEDRKTSLWVCTTTHAGHTSIGRGINKSTAKKRSFQTLYDLRFGNSIMQDPPDNQVTTLL